MGACSDINMVVVLFYTAAGALCSVGNGQYCYPTSCQSGLCQHVKCTSSHFCLVSRYLDHNQLTELPEGLLNATIQLREL